MGQVNVLTLVLGLLGLRLAIVGARDGLAGLAIGAMVAIKPYGVTLLVPFLIRGRWRLAAGAAAAFAVATLAVAAPRSSTPRSRSSAWSCCSAKSLTPHAAALWYSRRTGLRIRVA
jgi:hypothetical protein